MASQSSIVCIIFVAWRSLRKLKGQVTSIRKTLSPLAQVSVRKYYVLELMWILDPMWRVLSVGGLGSHEITSKFVLAIAHDSLEPRSKPGTGPRFQGKITTYHTISVHTNLPARVATHTCASLLITTERSFKRSHDLPIWDADARQMMLLIFCSFVQRNLWTYILVWIYFYLIFQCQIAV